MKFKHALETPIQTLKTILFLLQEDGLLNERMAKNAQLSFERIREILSNFSLFEEKQKNNTKSRINGLTIWCKDLQLSKRFYEDILKFKYHSHFFDQETNLNGVKLTLGIEDHTEILLIECSPNHWIPPQFLSLSLEEDRFHQILDYIKEIEMGIKHKDIEHYEKIDLKDPNGVRIELCKKKVHFYDAKN